VAPVDAGGPGCSVSRPRNASGGGALLGLVLFGMSLGWRRFTRRAAVALAGTALGCAAPEGSATNEASDGPDVVDLGEGGPRTTPSSSAAGTGGGGGSLSGGASGTEGTASAGSAGATSCAGETLDGRCDGNTLVRCDSFASGTVSRTPCGAGKVCLVADDGIAQCTSLGAPGCGNVTYQGFCEGSTLVYCYEDAIVREDCAAEGKACGYADSDIGNDCIASPVSSGSQKVHGSFHYERPRLTEHGLGDDETRPVRRALVKILRGDTDEEVGRGYTTESGTFDVAFEASGSVYAAVAAAGNPESDDVSVQDCPSDACTSHVHAKKGAEFSAGSTADVGDVTIEGEDIAGAFSIFDNALRGIDFAVQNFGKRPPHLVIRWEHGSGTGLGTSYFTTSGGRTIYLLGTYGDSDEYDDPVQLHEYGHFLENAFSRSDSPGGSHDGSATDPNLAWGEGYGTFTGAAIAGSAMYVDTFASGATVHDLDDTGYSASSSYGMKQYLSEYTVAESLWHLSNGMGTEPGKGYAPIFDVLTTYFPGDALADRGVGGVDFVDLLDGWFCRGHGDKAFVSSVVVDHMDFPYDFQGPAGCKP
jgi:hypothetical protein